MDGHQGLGLQCPNQGQDPSIYSNGLLCPWCSVVWNNKFKHNIIHKGTNFILSNLPYYTPNHINYWDCLVQLNLLPTSYRREFLNLTFFLKSLQHKTTYKVEDHVKFQTRPTWARTRNVDVQKIKWLPSLDLIENCNIDNHVLCIMCISIRIDYCSRKIIKLITTNRSLSWSI